MIFCAGLGGPIENEYASFGDTTDPVVLAERLDEGLELLARNWSGLYRQSAVLRRIEQGPSSL